MCAHELPPPLPGFFVQPSLLSRHLHTIPTKEAISFCPLICPKVFQVASSLGASQLFFFIEIRLYGRLKYDCRLLNPLNPELNPICYLLALLGAQHFLHVSRIGVKSLTLRLLMSYIYIYIYIYGAPILDVYRSHTTTHHSR